MASVWAARGAEHDDVGLLQFDIALAAGILYALVVVIHRDCKHLFGGLLADHVLIEHRLEFGGLGQRRAVKFIACDGVLGNDLLAQADALVTDVHARPGDDSAHLILRFAAERAFNELADPLITFSHVSPHIWIYACQRRGLIISSIRP